MSRNLTPQELLYFEEKNLKTEHGVDLFAHMRGLYIKFNGEEKQRIHSDKEMDIREKYPLLGKLYSKFYELYQDLENIPKGIETLDNLEKELEDYVYNKAGDMESPVIKWFLGELDESFHYSMRNNALLYNYVIETAKTSSIESSLENKIHAAEHKKKNSNLKEYELILCKDEPEEEIVKAMLTKEQAAVIKDDLDGILSSAFHITTVDGRKIETGIIDEIREINPPAKNYER